MKKKVIPIAIILTLLFVLVPQPVSAAVESVEIRVTASSDDCRVAYDGSHWGLSLTDVVTVGHYSSEFQKMRSGLRFRNVGVPRDAVIKKAYLILTANSTNSATTVNTWITGEDADDAAAFSDYANYNARLRTTAFVYWNNIRKWTVDNEYGSPDIKTVIQEIVDRGGWSSGNDMVLFWVDDGSTKTDGTCRRAYAYDDSSTKAPELYIEYTSYAYSTSDIDEVINELDSEVDKLRSQVSELRSQVDELDSTISVLGGLESRLKSSLESSLSSLDEKYVNLDKKLNALEENVSTLVVEVKTSEGSASERIEELKGRLTTMTLVFAAILAFLCIQAMFVLIRKKLNRE